MIRKLTWIIPSTLVLTLLGVLALLPASAAPSGVVGTIALTGGEGGLGLFYSDKAGFNVATATVTDADLSTTRTGTARIDLDSANVGSTNPLLLTGSSNAHQKLAILAGETADTVTSSTTGSGTLTVAMTATKLGRDADDDGDVDASDITLKVGGVTKTPDSVNVTAGAITSVVVSAADNAVVGSNNVTVALEYSEYDQATTLTPIATASVTFGADFLSSTTMNNQTVDVVNNTDRTIKTTSNMAGATAATDSAVVSFTYNVLETKTKLITWQSSSLSSRGLTRANSGTESTSSSSKFTNKVAFFSGADFDKIITAAASAGIDTIDEIEAHASVGATLGARVGTAALALGATAAIQASANSDVEFIQSIMPVADGEVVTVSYDDGGTTRSDTADMDMKAPTIAITSPASATNSNSLAQTVIVTVTDENSAGGKASGMTVGNADTLIVETRSNGTIHDAANDENLVPLLVATNSFQISRSLTFTASDEGTIRYWVPAKDDVGNVATFADSRTLPEKAQGVANPAIAAAGNPDALSTRPGNPGTIILDVAAPAPITNAVKTGGEIDTRLTTIPTGSHTAADNQAAMTDALASLVVAKAAIGDVITNLTDGSKCTLTAVAATVGTCTLAGGVENNWDTGDNYKITNPGLSNAKVLNTATTSLVVEFGLGTGTSKLDGSTVDAADFTVADSTVTSAVVDLAGTKILLGVETALATDAKPKWGLSGEVKDLAGNTVATVTGTSEVAALDGLAPVIATPTITGVVGSATNDSVTIDFSSGEAAATTPVVQATYLQANADTTYEENGAQTKSLSVTANGVNTWQAKVDIDDITGASKAGMVNVRVSLADSSGNTASAGKTDPDGTTAANKGVLVAGALVFEFDNRLNEGVSAATKIFTVSPDTKATTDVFETDSTTPYITMDFDAHTPTQNAAANNVLTGGEDKEYTVGTIEGDTRKTVTLTSATWTDPDGVATDVLASINTADVNSFVYAPTGLAVGSHTLAIQAKDEVGNVSTSIGSTTPTTFSLTLSVVARAAYKVPVKPGMNLISIPAEASVTGIDDVIGADSGINFAMTYDNASGLWQVSELNTETGLWEGNLANIDSAHAYWVQSDRFVNLEFSIPRSTAGQAVFPTVVPVNIGWNAVPVGDPAQSAAGSNIAANTYFSGLTWSAAYAYSPSTSAWTKIVAGGNVKTGQGYFLYVTKDGVIIP